MKIYKNKKSEKLDTKIEKKLDNRNIVSSDNWENESVNLNLMGIYRSKYNI